MYDLRRFIYIFFLVFLILGQTSTAQGQSSLDNSYPVDPGQQMINRLHLVADGIEIAPEDTPFLLDSGRAVISLQSLQNIIPYQSEWGPDGEIIVLWEQSRIQLYPDKNLMLINSIPQSLDLAPFKSVNGGYFLPLRALGEALGYKILYDASSQTIQLNSPGYQAPPQSVIIPPQPVPIDYNTLPTWGSILSIPGLAELWPDETIVAGYFTRLVNSPAGRTNNVILSSAKVNEKILQAGEIFSFNQTVGQRTAQNGYLNAKIFAGKKVVTGIGGGICQTSSTLYNVALEAGLQVLERYPHSLKVVYTPPNRDATVSWGGADFKFRNTSGFPLKLLCKVDNGYVFAVFVKAQPVASIVSTPSP